ncbi:hypothetical protein [Pseudomonas vancouverensis]|uniref:Uncharacterized protein n=1 Tax=Pseudomonas vancouverensis TaxID=95300 RepID=A0A1H2NTL4_PSEVA|nr:hypothetical protein [Pseudomonas vancouverensis]KAB0491100.1 hypothetical protein F7R09_25695 [Pseudomonas vancouverensis]TDB59688.1 hypothetical protein EIY72_18965 [Pseudomonas vancouverensis]SDV08491.1 hypothetical protein SAMN05216558_2902 [Pseudomonas vancouverensis]
MSAFETYWFPLILAVCSTALGAWLSVWLPKYLSTRRYSRREDLLGVWDSTWQDADDANQWVTEKVEIDIADGQLRLRNSDNVGGYRWQGTCELYEDHYLHGTWKSLKKAAPSSGVFSFLMLPQGEVMVGQAMGADKFGTPRTSDWILARQAADIDIGKKWLIKHATYYRG